jgi:Secretion system C-terminal sorting domain
MKKTLLITFFTAFFAATNFAQVIVNKNITTNTTWTANNIYQIENGFIYVTDNAILTIEAGTIIKGKESALVITRGAKIIAKGTAQKPIVFTSSKDKGKRNIGDWAGLVILGKAPINVPGGESIVEGGLDATLGKFGGTDPNDNSGVLSYVRIEFAGIAFQQDKEVNSLTLGGIGAATQIDHVQCSFGGDDAFEWFGGTVSGKYLIAFKTVDDMFDTDFGYNGKNQFLLGISDPQLADVSGSNGFESDNDGQGTTNTPFTDATFSNVTIAGPKVFSATFNNNFRRGAHIRRASKQDILNATIVGFPTVYRPENKTVDYILDGSSLFKNNLFDENKLIDSSKNTTLAPKYGQVEAKVKGDNAVSTLVDINFTDAKNNNFLPKVGSALLGGANFDGLDNFFEKTTFRGAFGTTDWTAGWANFDPQNTDYSKPVAVKEIETLNKALLFPNPTNENTTLSLDFTENTTATVQIINFAGQILFSQNIENQSNNVNINLPTANFTNGLYFINIAANNGIKTLKLQVIR